MPKIRIVLVDDHPVFRCGLRLTLEAEPDMEVVGEARTGEEAVGVAQAKHPNTSCCSTLGSRISTVRRSVSGCSRWLQRQRS